MFLRMDRMERKEESKRILEALMGVKNGIRESKETPGGDRLSAPSPLLLSRSVRSPSPKPIMTRHRPKQNVDLAVSKS